VKNHNQPLLLRLGGDLGLLVHRDYRGLIYRSSIVKVSVHLRKAGDVAIADYVEMDPLSTVRATRIPNNSLGLVMLAMLAIPRGFVASYSDIAELLNMTPRLVGLFASRNPIPVIVPCHRVVNRDGTVGGYSAWARDGRGVKALLLSMERVRINGFKVDREHFMDPRELKDNFYRIYNYYHALISERNGHSEED
jgi:methylated-DNA-[protein]-cysteine S-methyltransferase